METSYKPTGYNSLSPYLVVKGAQKMIDLLKHIFDAKELRKYDLKDGSIMHAELRIDDSVVMLGDSSEKYPPNRLLIHVYVEDVDDVFERAIEAGCEVLELPAQKGGDPDKRGSFRDFSGNTWAIGTQVSF